MYRTLKTYNNAFALSCAALLLLTLTGCGAQYSLKSDPQYLETALTNETDCIDDMQEPRITATVRSAKLNLRAGSALDSPAIASLTKGQSLTVQMLDDGWAYVETTAAMSGWVWAPMIEIDGRKFTTAKYRGMTHILVSRNYFLGPDGKRRHKLKVRGLELTSPLARMRATSRFGIRKKHPVNGGRNKMHQGVDYKASTGTKVSSAARGTVKSVKRGPSYGIYVDIDHGLGITTRYAHLDKALVKKGQRVRSGSLIGYSGNTGATTGPHLHFEIRARGKAVNPVTYLRRF